MRESSSLRKLGFAALFILPALILFTGFILGPMAYSLRISFFDWNIVKPERSEWVGFANYVQALTDPVFGRAVLNTLAYTFVTVPGQILVGLTLAVLLDQDIRAKGFFRLLYYLPVITDWVIVSVLFEYLFSGQLGFVNYVLKELHLIQTDINWLANEILVFVPIHLLGIWKGMGWTAIVLLAGLQTIPDHLYEAAEVDGANGVDKFFHITLPLLRPTLVFTLVVLTIGALNAYIPNLVITNGGDPLDLTHFILTLMYEETFTRLEFGYGAAISYLLAVLVFVVSVFQIRMLRRRVEV